MVDFDDRTITDAIDRLKARGLARMVYAGSGARAVKYRQVLDEQLGLEPDQRALLTVLLLRGPQAPGELKTRTERLHGFADRTEVEACLTGLASGAAPMVRELERLPGQQDNRWIHLLGPVDIGTAGSGGGSAKAPAVDRDIVIAEGPRPATPRSSRPTTRWPPPTPTQLIDELDDKPLDRWLLERIVDLADGGPVADAGCGPGQVGFHLAAAGADVTGFDLSPGMVAEARSRFPELRFEVADLTALPAPEAEAGGRPSRPGTRWCTWPAPSCARPSPCWPARSAPAGGWRSRCTSATRSATRPSCGASRSTSTSCSTTRLPSSTPSPPPVWWTWSGTAEAPARAARPRPSASTCWPAAMRPA